MNKILILGSGLVSRPGVRYLLKQGGLEITVASLMIDVAEELVKGFANGKAVYLDVSDTESVTGLIKENDLVISLLPWTLHEQIGRLCLEHSKHFVTASYTADWAKELDGEIKDKGLFFLNEIGVDPGFDHMTAMKVIHEVQEEGGKVLRFTSNTGGLPAPDDNDNPFGYKFSWSPKGVLLASSNSARWLEDGDVVEIPGEDLFLNYHVESVEGVGALECYANRDSVPYKDIYGLDSALTVKRGTYRYQGWCDTLKKMVDVGLIEEKPVPGGYSFNQIMADLAGTEPGSGVKEKTAEKLGLTVEDPVISRFEWLGLFDESKVPTEGNVLDNLCQLMQEKLAFAAGEKDMIVMQHQFEVENADASRDMITSTLIDYGIPNGDSSMARTVSLPLAIAVRMFVEGRIKLSGVQIPITPDIYEPVLTELAELGIEMSEKRERI